MAARTADRDIRSALRAVSVAGVGRRLAGAGAAHREAAAADGVDGVGGLVGEDLTLRGVGGQDAERHDGRGRQDGERAGDDGARGAWGGHWCPACGADVPQR